jgi:hypothetical protein
VVDSFRVTGFTNDGFDLNVDVASGLDHLTQFLAFPSSVETYIHKWIGAIPSGQQLVTGVPFTPTLALNFTVSEPDYDLDNHAIFTLGVANSSAQWTFETFAENLVTIVDLSCFLLDGAFIRQRDIAGSNTRTATFIQFLADGMEINWAETGAEDIFITVFFRDIQSHIEVIQPPAIDGQQVVPTAITPQASLVASVGVGNRFTQMYSTVGLSDGITQNSHTIQMLDQPRPSEARQRVDTGSSIYLEDQNKVPRGKAAVTFAGNNVLLDWTEISDVADRPVGILAMDSGGVAPYQGSFQFGSVAGALPVGGVPFAPDSALFLGNRSTGGWNPDFSEGVGFAVAGEEPPPPNVLLNQNPFPCDDLSSYLDVEPCDYLGTYGAPPDPTWNCDFTGVNIKTTTPDAQVQKTNYECDHVQPGTQFRRYRVEIPELEPGAGGNCGAPECEAIARDYIVLQNTSPFGAQTNCLYQVPLCCTLSFPAETDDCPCAFFNNKPRPGIELEFFPGPPPRVEVRYDEFAQGGITVWSLNFQAGLIDATPNPDWILVRTNIIGAPQCEGNFASTVRVTLP